MKGYQLGDYAVALGWLTVCLAESVPRENVDRILEDIQSTSLVAAELSPDQRRRVWRLCQSILDSAYSAMEGES